ncbi:hypothetical protein, partial [Hydrogenibacillus schlegelii]|uniref:hypothetical protein n=1 Tax=Hydrogenibacillus schlegelii TaxID=1484 RepID=UPI0034A0A1C2
RGSPAGAGARGVSGEARLTGVFGGRPAAPPPALVDTMRLEEGAVLLEALQLARLFSSKRH